MAGEATEHGRSRPDTVDDQRHRWPPLMGSFGVVARAEFILGPIEDRTRGFDRFSQAPRGWESLQPGPARPIFLAGWLNPVRPCSARLSPRQAAAPRSTAGPGLSIPRQPRDRPRRTSGSWAQDAFPSRRDREKHTRRLGCAESNGVGKAQTRAGYGIDAGDCGCSVDWATVWSCSPLSKRHCMRTRYWCIV